jgi:hypothetical protein
MKGPTVAKQSDVPVGISELRGKTIVVISAIYIYTGKLVDIGETAIKLADPSIIYETGSWSSEKWADAQRLPCTHLYVSIALIESFAAMKGDQG